MKPIRLPALTIALLFLIPAAYADLTDGLVAHYAFEGNANDSSGNSYHGQAFGGVSYAQGVYGNAAVFDGIDDYISITDNSVGNLGTNASMAFWIKPTTGSFSSGQHRILDKDNTSFLIFDINAGNVNSYLRDSATLGGPQHNIALASLSNPTPWVSIVMVKNTNHFDFYVDGTSVFSNTTVIDEMITSANLVFGYSPYWDDFHYEGLLDEVRIYDRSLNSAEIAALSIPEPGSIVVMAGVMASGWFIRRFFCV